MERIYQYKGFTLEVTVESKFTRTLWSERTSIPAYVVAKIGRTGAHVAFFSPLRLGDFGERAFSSLGDRLVG